MEEKEVKTGKTSWILIGFALAFLGGFIGMIIGGNYAFGNFDRKTKLYGYVMLVISIVVVKVITSN
jgi:hypothetical protein